MREPFLSRQIPQEIVAAAAEWVGLLDAEEASDGDRAACEAWCAENPLHRSTFDRMRAFHDRLDDSAAIERVALRRLASAPKRRVRRGVSWSITILALAGLSWTALRSNLLDHFPDYRTAKGEQETIALASGTIMTLDTDTAVRVSEREGRDMVRLVSGRLFAQVKHGRDRRFVVETSLGTATALGTAYTVELANDAMFVDVAASRVRVCPSNEGDHVCRDLLPGDRARVRGGKVALLDRADPMATASWTSGWIEAVDEDLSTVLDRLNSYRSEPIIFDRAALSGVKVSGIFPIKDQEAALRGVVASSRTKLIRSPDGTVEITR